MRQRKDKIAVVRLAAFRQPFQRFVRNRHVKWIFGLLHRDFDADTPTAPLKVAPPQFANVADTQAAQATEQKSQLDDLVPTFCIYQRLQLVDCQILAAARLLSNFTCEIELFGRIGANDSLFVGAVDCCAKRSE